MTTILIVEDEVDLRELVAHHVVAAGMTALQAGTGNEGLALARSKKPDLILLDVEMPGMDGRQVWRALQTAPELRQIPVVFVSAEDPRRHPEMDAVGWIRKPFSAQVVQNDVQGRLRQVRQL